MGGADVLKNSQFDCPMKISTRHFVDRPLIY